MLSSAINSETANAISSLMSAIEGIAPTVKFLSEIVQRLHMKASTVYRSECLKDGQRIRQTPWVVKDYQKLLSDLKQFLQRINHKSLWKGNSKEESGSFDAIMEMESLNARLDRCHHDLSLTDSSKKARSLQADIEAYEDDLDYLIGLLVTKEQYKNSAFLKRTLQDLANALQQLQRGDTHEIREIDPAETEEGEASTDANDNEQSRDKKGEKKNKSPVLERAELVLKNLDDPENALKADEAKEASVLEIQGNSVVVLDVLSSKGRFGTVYRGKYAKGPLVALKQFNPQLSEDELRKEVLIQHKLCTETPYVATMHGYARIALSGQGDEICYAVMELASCGSLGDLLEYATGKNGLLAYRETRSANISVNAIITLLYEVTLGLEYVHSQCFVHQAIKPQNILFDKSLTPKLTDFGISRARSNSAFYYMAPELAQKLDSHSNYTYGADIYSLGVVLHEVCQRTYGHVHTVTPRKDKSLPRQFPETLNTIRNTCLASDPKKRYGRSSYSAGRLSNALYDVLESLGGSVHQIEEETSQFIKLSEFVFKVSIEKQMMGSTERDCTSYRELTESADIEAALPITETTSDPDETDIFYETRHLDWKYWTDEEKRFCTIFVFTTTMVVAVVILLIAFSDAL